MWGWGLQPRAAADTRSVKVDPNLPLPVSLLLHGSPVVKADLGPGTLQTQNMLGCLDGWAVLKSLLLLKAGEVSPCLSFQGAHGTLSQNPPHQKASLRHLAGPSRLHATRSMGSMNPRRMT